MTGFIKKPHKKQKIISHCFWCHHLSQPLTRFPKITKVHDTKFCSRKISGCNFTDFPRELIQWMEWDFMTSLTLIISINFLCMYVPLRFAVFLIRWKTNNKHLYVSFGKFQYVFIFLLTVYVCAVRTSASCGMWWEDINIQRYKIMAKDDWLYVK